MQECTVGLLVRANLATWVQPLPVSVDWLRPRDASARNGAVSRTAIEATNAADGRQLLTYQYRQALRPPVFGRFNRFTYNLQVLPTDDSYFYC
jgi:hypothetical protein